ncbi:MAG: hypothetical protein WBZ20_19035 [Nitrososphaeraceae archaeon]|jgi:hypothetical protein
MGLFDVEAHDSHNQYIKYFEDRVQKVGNEEIKIAIKKTGSNNVNIVVGFDPADFPDGEEIKNSSDG